MQVDAQCGQGAPGAGCVSCNATGGTCDTVQGQCVIPQFDGGGGGFDGGFPLQCTTASDCGPNMCCDNIFGLGFCVAAGQACIFTGTCNPSLLICL